MFVRVLYNGYCLSELFLNYQKYNTNEIKWQLYEAQAFIGFALEWEI